ncbi:hypothetical protein JOF56_006429 [Kibdelosporangium banguiense]|uniref:CBM6 domain-containing protein n=1 Tax=Kibdelosporangium banguiense TaxID=1365924 RepID=A0ABS4TNR2_9PSEU|nr:carbohydrate-binding domain-containing protein [Kibdelosporangium banguiense]MBP2326044.1 hypothetical protein [Kibdelosporangium banguiense]
MRRSLKWALSGAASCAAAGMVVTLLVSQPDAPAGAQIVVPQGQDSELPVTTQPPQSTVSVLLPTPSVGPAPSSPDAQPPPSSSTSARTPKPAPPPQQAPERTPPQPQGVDFQAENATIRNGRIESNHAGFTGSGFVDYDNEVGSSVEWTVTALATTSVNVVFRYTNASSENRPMDITVNGIKTASVNFPPTNGWEDWRTLTIRVNLLAGTSKIRATATTSNGGPNVDKITVV